jgi:molybdopterin-guanine dinucleotide biosynthesis protein A
MQRSGFVLAGGRSTRMGRDKALLPYRGTTLVDQIARAVREVAGSVALIGDPSRYADLGYPVYEDMHPGCGPLGGVYTALTISMADWNLIVACDMPGVSVAALRQLLDSTKVPGKRCVIATGPDGERHPLLAVYHRSCLGPVERAIRDKRLKMKDLMSELEPFGAFLDCGELANVNTPGEWARFEEKPK